MECLPGVEEMLHLTPRLSPLHVPAPSPFASLDGSVPREVNPMTLTLTLTLALALTLTLTLTLTL